MMKGWTRRLGRSKSSNSEKNRKNAAQAAQNDDNAAASTNNGSGKAASTDSSSKPSVSPSTSGSSAASKHGNDGGFHGFSLGGGTNNGDKGTDPHIRPEAFDMNNTGVSSRRTSSSSMGSRDSLANAIPSKRRSGSNKDLAGQAHPKPHSQPSKQTRSSIASANGGSGDLRVQTKGYQNYDGVRSPISPTSPLNFGQSRNASSNSGNSASSIPNSGSAPGSGGSSSPSIPNGGGFFGSTFGSSAGIPNSVPGTPDAVQPSMADFRGANRRGSLDRMDGLDTPQRHNSSRLEVSAERQLEQLPSFDEVPPQEHMDSFFAKIEQCNVMFNFSDPGSDAQGKEIKRIASCELIDFASNSDIFSGGERVYDAVFGMFSRNIIRSIPPPKNPFGEIFDPDDDEPVNVDAWPHMSLVYEFFLRFIDAPDSNVAIARQYIDQPFISSSLESFDSEDPRERDFSKTTSHRVYGKFLGTRPFIRRSINNVFLQFIYETGRFNGVAESLEIFGSIINGFAIPSKEEHKVFSSRVSSPLHTARSLGLYHSHSTYCIVQFLEKDPSLTQEVVMGSSRYWPKVNSPKEVSFSLELEDIFEAMEPNEFQKVEVPVFHQLARCISSPHGQVAERASCNWTHEYFSTMVADNSEVISPILFPALCENSGHWNRTIHSMVHSATKMFLEANPMLYEKCAAEYRERKLSEKDDKAVREQSWKEVEKMAQKRLEEKQQQKQQQQKEQSPQSPQQGQNQQGPVLSREQQLKEEEKEQQRVDQRIKSRAGSKGGFSAILPGVTEDPSPVKQEPASAAHSRQPSQAQVQAQSPVTPAPSIVEDSTQTVNSSSTAKQAPSVNSANVSPKPNTSPANGSPPSAVATAVTTQKRPTSTAAPSSISGLQYSKKSPSIVQTSTRPSSQNTSSSPSPITPAAEANAISSSSSIISTTSQNANQIPLSVSGHPEPLNVPGVTPEPAFSESSSGVAAASAAATTTAAATTAARPSTVSNFQSPATSVHSASIDDDSSNEEGFEDAPGYEDPRPSSPTASPHLMSCPSSPEE